MSKRQLRGSGRGFRALAGLTAAVAVGLLAACSGTKETRACPKVEVIDDLSRLVQFADGPGRDLTDVAYVARIQDVKSACEYDKSGVHVDMTVSILGDRARAGTKLRGSDVSYFVAITDPSHAIIAKKIFTSRLDFSDDKPATINDELDQYIPLPPLAAAADHSIIVGFQLTPEQIDLNHKRQQGS